MARRAKDADREQRIHMDIIVDAYGPEEQATSWYIYLAETLQFPFPATCTALRAISPLEPGDEFDVVGMAPEEECQHEMFVLTRWRPHERFPNAAAYSVYINNIADLTNHRIP